MADPVDNQRELTGDDALRFARESGMERASETRVLFLCGVGDLIRFARLVREGWNPGAVAGYCTEGDRCNCGGDLPHIQAACANWRGPGRGEAAYG